MLLEVIFMSNPKAELIEFIAGFTHDPLGFVVSCFPWGQGELANYTGPDEWQKNVLKHIGEELRNGVKSEQEVIREAVASGNGIGKASTFSTIVDTPQGKRVWGYLEPGDYLFGADGKPTRIIATKRYEDIPFYRVSFDDGTYCDVSSGHLWNVKNRQDRRVGNNWRTLSTLDILNAGVLRKAGHKPNGEQHWAKQWEIPIQGEVEFPYR